MPDRREEIAKELDQLVSDGGTLRMAEVLRSRPKEERAEIAEEVVGMMAEGKSKSGKSSKAKTKTKRGAPSAQAKAMLNYLEERDFGEEYQHWYSSALRVVEQLLPDRYDEFRELYRLDKKPKLHDVITYGISDYIHGTAVTRSTGEVVFNTASVAMTKFKDQISILASARSRLESSLADIEGTLETTLLDDELDTATELLKAKHLRSAGIVAGVVLERHLKTVLANHEVTLRKKPQIGNLNDALKEAKVFSVPRWREVQRLADIRNLCGHDGEEPKAEEVQELIGSTEKIIATVF
jgi:hypothetical protein